MRRLWRWCSRNSTLLLWAAGFMSLFASFTERVVGQDAQSDASLTHALLFFILASVND